MIFLTFIFACAIIMPSFLFFFPYSILIAGFGALLGILGCLCAVMYKKSRDCTQQGQVLNVNAAPATDFTIFSGDILTFSLLGEDQEITTCLLWYTCIIIPLNLVDLINAPFLFIYFFFFLKDDPSIIQTKMLVYFYSLFSPRETFRCLSTWHCTYI